MKKFPTGGDGARISRSLRLFPCLVILLSLGACAGMERRALLERGVPERAAVAGLPFIEQDALQCGPAALAMVLAGAGRIVSVAKLADAMFTKKAGGTFREDLIGAARREGMLAYVIEPRLEALLGEVAGGNPVIVLLNFGFSWYPRWHFGVVTGFDMREGEFHLHAGEKKETILSFALFVNSWQRSGNWGALVLPPGRLPAEGVPEKYAQAVFELERVAAGRGAGEAYRAAIRSWPQSALLESAYINFLYTSGDRRQATERALEAAGRFPEEASLLNNLAQMLLEAGRAREALPYARKAAQIPGPFQEVCRKTLLEVERGAGIESSPSRSIRSEVDSTRRLF